MKIQKYIFHGILTFSFVLVILFLVFSLLHNTHVILIPKKMDAFYSSLITLLDLIYCCKLFQFSTWITLDLWFHTFFQPSDQEVYYCSCCLFFSFFAMMIKTRMAPNGLKLFCIVYLDFTKKANLLFLMHGLGI